MLVLELEANVAEAADHDERCHAGHNRYQDVSDAQDAVRLVRSLTLAYIATSATTPGRSSMVVRPLSRHGMPADLVNGLSDVGRLAGLIPFQHKGLRPSFLFSIANPRQRVDFFRSK